MINQCHSLGGLKLVIMLDGNWN